MKDLKAKGRAAAGVLASVTMIASMSAAPALAAQPADGAAGAGGAPRGGEPTARAALSSRNFYIMPPN